MNNYCTFEQWSIADLVDSYNNDIPDKKKKLVIYKRQRNVVWKDEQKKALIQSIKEGYPVGALLIYKSKENSINGITQYLLVDGLQRSTTILEYYNKPTKYVDKSFFDNNVDTLVKKLNEKVKITKDEVINLLCSYVKEREGFEEKNGFSSSKASKFIMGEIGINDSEFKDSVEDILIPIMEEVKESADITNTQIPVIIYNGDISNLPDIFYNINKQGTQLSKYEVYSAIWSKEDYLITINNKKIIEYIVKRYEEIQENGFEIQDFDEENNEIYNQKYSVFEYIFGLSKYIMDIYSDTNMFGSTEDSSIDSIIFNLCSMCIQKDTKKMESLHIELMKLDVECFEKALLDSIDVVYKAIRPYIDLKLNSNKKTVNKNKEIYHKDFQLVSLIASVFNNKYIIRTINEERKELVSNDNWDDSKVNDLSLYYLYDIIKNTFNSRVDTTAKNIVEKNIYFKNVLTKRDWNSVLDFWFAEQLKKEDKKRQIKVTEKLFLKYIYAHKLSSYDENGINEFHLDHIISVDELKKVCQQLERGLPINCVANLGLLKKDINLKKGTSNIYEFYEKMYNDGQINESKKNKLIKEAEDKLIIDRKLLDKFNKNKVNSEIGFINSYVDFLQERFEHIKELFYELNNIIE